MARIRSIHPGFFSDESVVACSFAGRFLLIGIWGEADDNGVFEWKPISLKMRIMPADNVDIPTLLTELETHNIIRKFTHDGKTYGAVRNFALYQRPKKPKSRYFIPDEFRTYLGLDKRSTELSDDEDPPVPKKAEISPQMEDVGGSNSGGARARESLITPEAFRFSDEFLAAIGADREAPEWFGTPYQAQTWISLGIDKTFSLAVAAQIAGRKKPLPNLRYFDVAIRRAHEERAANPTVESTNGRHAGKSGTTLQATAKSIAERLVALEKSDGDGAAEVRAIGRG